MGSSNVLLAVLHTLTLLISTVMIIGVIFVSGPKSATECDAIADVPIFAIGIILLLLSVSGLVGSIRMNTPIWIHLFFMIFVMGVILAFIIFSQLVIGKGVSDEVMSNGRYNEYKVSDFSHWLRSYVGDKDTWNKGIKNCFNNRNICHGFIPEPRFSMNNTDKMTFNKFTTGRLIFVQVGCCKPPISCGYTWQNKTSDWDLTDNTKVAGGEKDCEAWQNLDDVKCFDCNTCKAGYMALLRITWMRLMAISASVLAFLAVIFAVAQLGTRRVNND